jgi:hypothetical protein
MAVFTQASPCIPIMPSERGWRAGKPPSPNSVSATGMSVLCTSSSKSPVAFASITPWPQKMIGRFASVIISAASFSSSGSGCRSGR